MKKSLILILSIFMAFGLAGCGSSDSASTSTNGSSQEATGDDTQEDEVVELTWWARASSAENNQTITMEEFSNQNDNINVNVECYGDNYSEVFKLACNSRELPDIYEVTGIPDINSYYEAGFAEPFNDYMTDDFKAMFNPSAFSQYNIDGNVYAIPNMTRFIRVYYNRDLFEEAGLDPDNFPTTLEGMYDAAKQITEAGNGEYYGLGLPLKSTSTWERTVDDICILSGISGPYAFDYSTGRFDFSKQKPIIQYFSKMYQDGLVMPGSESMDVEIVRANFLAGKIGMYFDGNWMINGYNNEIEGGDVTNWDCALVPIPEGTKRAKDYLMLDSGHSISSTSEHKEEAFEAISYFLQNLYTAPTRKDPSVVTPAFSLIESYNDEVNSQPAVQELKGINGATVDNENLSAFPQRPHTVLTLEGDSRDVVYPILVIQGDKVDIDKELDELTERYNKALDDAIDEGLLNPDDLIIDGFDYYTR